MSYEIINLTPHEVRVEGTFGANVYPASGQVARLDTVERVRAKLIGAGEHVIEVVDVRYGDVIEAARPHEGVLYIVSLVTALAAKRGDFLVPYGEIRDDSGRIIAVRALARVV